MKTILQHTLLLNFLLCCWIPNAGSNTPTNEHKTEHEEHVSETPTQMSALPELSSPTDQATNVSVTPNLQWTDTGSSYTVEVYNCTPDYGKVGKLHLSDFSVDFINTNLDSISDDFSGATYNSTTNSSFYVINGGDAFGAERVVELDNNGVQKRHVDLDGFDDTEGIVWIGGNEYLILEEKNARVIKVSINSNTTNITYPNNYIQLTINGCDNGDCVEGISYNPFTNEVILANEIEPKPEIYVFTLPTTISGVVNVTPTQPFDAEMKLLVDDLAGLHHLSLTEGLGNMNVSSHFLALSEQSKILIETDLDGNIHGSLDLTAGNAGLLVDINQPEGVTMDNQGNIYIASEKDDFYRFTNSALDLNPFGLDPNTTFTDNNVTTNSLTIPAGALGGSTEYCWRVKDNTTGAWSDYYSFTTEMIDCSTDRDALIALYNATNGAAWDEDNAGGRWNLNLPMSDWQGVTLDANGCVIGLEMVDNGLDGTLPPELGNLSQLQVLDLRLNHDLVGQIPAELGQLTNLRELRLYSNSHTGSIPPELGQLDNLEELNLRTNFLTGPIPPELGDMSSLEILNLSMNQLVGGIPPELGNLPNIRELILMVNNNLGGTIPTSLTQLSTLVDLRLGICNLSGNVPDFSGLTSIEKLFINHNNFTGNIPSSLGSLTTLENLSLQENFLTGGIPSALGSLSSLRYLDLSDNPLGGSMNTALCNLSNLYSLDLRYNSLAGAIPSCLGNLPDLTFLYLEGNGLTGNIPPTVINSGSLQRLSTRNNQLSGCYDPKLSALCSSLESNYNTNYFISDGNNFDLPWDSFCSTGTACVVPCDVSDREALIALYNATDGANWENGWDINQPMNTWYGVTLTGDGCVKQLQLSGNNLNGTIPPELGDLSNLELLLLANNQLTDSIPPELGNLGSLFILDISGNQLSGSIPVELGNIPTLYYFYASYNQLTGSIPDELSNVLEIIDLTENQLSGAIPTTLNSNLRYLQLSFNQLTGAIPSEFGNMTNILTINLENNQLSGNIPSTLGNLPNLGTLLLGNNQLSGCYNDNLQNLCNLGYISIDLANNFDMPWSDFCSLGICVPCSTDYAAMVAFANSITTWGSTSPWNVTQPLDTWDGVTLNADGCVDAIDLDENNTSGTIPPELGNLTSIRTLHLGDNNFSGTIPPELGNLSTLTYLNLDGNALTGNIPPELGNISALTRMYLSYNQLTGSIPPELANLTNMWDLGVHSNQLSGCYDNQLLTLCGQLAYSSNSRISNGNSFNAPWEDFCATTAGSCTVVACPTQQEQYDALKAFYLNTDGDNWTDNDNWPTAAFFNANPTVPAGMTFANWDALVVNGDGCVIRMDFDDEHIFGIIPPEFGNLTTLEYLDLGSNNLSGSLPAELGNLSSLTFMNLSNNNFTGSVPPELGNLSSLESMYINYNNLFGSLPAELGNLPNILTLSIAGNNLSGNIPTELGNLPNLVYLRLDGNQLTGTIPASLGNVTSLTGLSLKNNQLSGCYDPSLQNLCGQLTNYFNSNTQISDGNNFNVAWEDFCNTGAGECVPVCTPDYNAMVAFHNAITDWGSMSPWDLTQPMNTWEGVILNANGCVEEITIDEEYVTGVIPPEIGNLSSLIKLELKHNNFVGSIPPELGNLTNLTYLNLSDNNFTGSIPPDLGNLSSVTAIYLTYNQLSGNIPPELGNLTNLTNLSLGTNQLSGSIPPEFGNLTNLTSLTLRANQLTGSIPATLGNMPNLTSLFLHDNQLSGCYDSNLTALCGQLTAYSNSNGISNGNNLDAPWEDFCANGTAACEACPADLNLSNILSTGTYQADETLNSASTVPAGTDVEFKAGEEILLNNGFTVEPGSDFSGEIEDCDGN